MSLQSLLETKPIMLTKGVRVTSLIKYINLTSWFYLLVYICVIIMYENLTNLVYWEDIKPSCGLICFTFNSFWSICIQQLFSFMYHVRSNNDVIVSYLLSPLLFVGLNISIYQPLTSLSCVTDIVFLLLQLVCFITLYMFFGCILTTLVLVNFSSCKQEVFT